MKINNSFDSDDTLIGQVKDAVVETGAALAAGVKKSASPPWKSVLVGGIPGILVGSGGALASRNALGPEFGVGTVDVGAEDSETGSEDNYDYESGASSQGGSSLDPGDIREAHSVSDEMSFGEAFASARSEVGPHGGFVWHGRVFSTFRADDREWQEMSAEDRASHSREILSRVHPSEYTPTDDEPAIVEVPSEDVEYEEYEVIDESDVHIIGTGGFEAYGEFVPVAFGEVDGVDTVFADTDGDGEVDLVLLDEDENVYITDDEIYNTEDSGLMMDDLTEQAHGGDGGNMLDDQLSADMPDYDNDVDLI